MERVLVAGGAGFLGSNLCFELNKLGIDFAIIDDFKNAYKSNINRLKNGLNIDFDWYEGDVVDLDFLDKVFHDYKPTMIVHYAHKKYIPESIDNSLDYYKNNLVSTLNLLEMAKKYSVNKFLFASSVTVYDEKIDKLIETDERKFTSPYVKTKIMCEEIITDFQQNNPDFCSIILRYTNPVGANTECYLGDRPKAGQKNVLPYLVDTVNKGEDIVINGGAFPTKDGSAVRDFIHVSDLAYITAKLLENITESGNYLFNVGTGSDGFSIKEIVETLQTTLNKKLEVKFNQNPDSRFAKILVNTNKLNNFINIDIKYSLEDIVSSQINLKQEGELDIDNE